MGTCLLTRKYPIVKFMRKQYLGMYIQTEFSTQSNKNSNYYNNIKFLRYENALNSLAPSVNKKF